MNRRTFILLASLSLGFSLPSLAADKIKVLILDGQNNHNWKSTTPILVQALEETGTFAVSVSTTPAKDAPAEAWESWRPKFSDYAAVVSNYNGANWPQAVKDDFLTYMKNGGGFVAVHAANNAFGDWKEYNEIIGIGGWGGRDEKSGPWIYVRDGKLYRDTSVGSGGSHGPQHEFIIEINQPEHPITKGLPARWLHAKDELYSNLRGPAENLEILSSALSDKTGKMEPNLMVINYGKGRVFHTTLGHADYSMLERGFFTTLQRGTEWAATGEVKAPVPADFNTVDKITVIAPKQEPTPSKP